VRLLDIPMSIMQRLGPNAFAKLEEALAARPDVVQSLPTSPERFEIIAESMTQVGNHRPPATPQSMPHMLASILGIRRSLRTVDQNPAQPRTHISETMLSELQTFARLRGVADIGYTKLPRNLVFQNKAVLHDNAIVLTMEMDKSKIDTSPSVQSAVEVMATYHHLGVASNKIADYLRQRGYSAHAGHPLMGLALYPPLAQHAGLGWRGMHGLIITPRFGPRVRLAAVFCSIENLPFSQKNEHQWIEQYCRLCWRCASECPPKAILEQPVGHENGLVTCIENEKCFPYFLKNYGCSICIRVCPFHHTDYARLRSSMPM
jgi:epoxyqueuosine reductase